MKLLWRVLWRTSAALVPLVLAAGLPAAAGGGTAEPQFIYNSAHGYHLALEKAGIRHVYYELPGTAHEWLTWWRDLHEFAPLLFQGPDAPGPPPASRVSARFPSAAR